MLRNYLIIALRNLRKQRAYALINVVGLALSVASALLLLLYVTDELSYDRYHEHADRIYRVAMDVQMGGEERKIAVVPIALAPTLTDRYAGVEQYALVRPLDNFKIVRDDEIRPLADVFFASATVFDLFTFPLLAGDPATALREPNAIVIDEPLAERLFPGQNALGQTLLGEDDAQYRVTGVMKSVLNTGHFRPQALVSIWDPEHLASWDDWNWASYVRVTPSARPASLRNALAEVYRIHLAERITALNGEAKFVLQPLSDIHFTSRRDFELRPNDGNMRYLYAFAVAAGLLLLVACINYVNLATARSLRRAKEVGVRKTLGSHRRQLVGQFLLESYLIVVAAVVVGVGLVVVLLPAFNRFTDKALRFGSLVSPVTLVGVVVFILLLGLLAGSYPALVLSRFRPVRVLRGNALVSRSMSGFTLRHGLVVVQFTVSIALLIGTLVITQQLAFLGRQSLGFDADQVLAVGLSDAAQERFVPLREALLRHPSIEQVTSAQYYPGQRPEINNFRLGSDVGAQDRVMQQTWVDHHFLETLNIPLVSGRNFAAVNPIDTAFDLPRAGVLVNETLVRAMGWTNENAIGRPISSGPEVSAGGWQDEVIGVVRDFHMTSLHEVIEPLVIRYYSAEGHILLRVRSQDVAQTLAAIQQTWDSVVGKTALNYRWLDEQFAQQYAQDERRGALFAGFSALTVLIACLGLFGLASYTVAQRTKEMGIRRVLGASVASLLALLVRTYAQLMLIALLVAVPVANYVVQEWLANFAYRTALRWWFFALPGAVILLVALLSVGQQTWRAARAKPVDSLRDE